MNKLKLLLVCFFLIGCGSHSVSRPLIEVNAESYTEQAIQAYAEERWRDARQLFNQALLNYQSLDDRLAVLLCHINLAEVALAQGDLPQAERNLLWADAIAKSEARERHQARISLLKARLSMKQLNMVVAKQLLNSLLPVFHHQELNIRVDVIQLAAIASRTEIAFLENQQANLWTSRYASALKQLSDSTDNLYARLFRFQAKLWLQQAEYSKAESLFQQALVIYKSNSLRSGIAAVLSELGQLYLQQGRLEPARDYYQRAIMVLHALGNDNKVKRLTIRLNELGSE